MNIPDTPPWCACHNKAKLDKSYTPAKTGTIAKTESVRTSSVITQTRTHKEMKKKKNASYLFSNAVGRNTYSRVVITEDHS